MLYFHGLPALALIHKEIVLLQKRTCCAFNMLLALLKWLTDQSIALDTQCAVPLLACESEKGCVFCRGMALVGLKGYPEAAQAFAAAWRLNGV